MAFGLSPAGTITKQATGIVSTRRIGVADSANISKGDVVFISATGFVDVASSADDGHYSVAIEPANNASGSDGDISVPLATSGHYVTVVADGAISPGERVKIGTVAGEVIAVLESTDAEEKVVGTYWGKEGGTIAKSATSADDFEESFTDDADFVPVDAAAADIIEVELR